MEANGICAAMALAASAGAHAAARWDQHRGPITTFTVRVDRGPDAGQNFGSLFEVPTSDGRLVIGAGFLGLYNTYFREDRHNIQFFIRPTDGARDFAVERPPRPTQDAGTYLFGLDGQLYACGDAHDEKIRRWRQDAARWEIDGNPVRRRMRLGDRLLLFEKDRVQFENQPILTAPETGQYDHFYYAHGRLFFYHTFWAEKQGYRLHTADAQGFTKLYACPWRPGDRAVDLAKAAVLTLQCVGENPFAFGQLHQDVLTCSNIGGVYVFDGRSWRTLVEPALGRSSQIYTALNFYDRLLLGHYPTGELYEFDGRDVKLLQGWPPRIDGVSPNAREAQTSVIYGGELFVGVWPWAELWRYSPDARNWTFVRRMFSHPDVTDRTIHPYENECKALGIVLNQWGQRITSLIPLGDSLTIGTSAKWPCEWSPQLDFAAGEKWKEYGAVIRLRGGGSLSAPVRWTNGPTELRFTVSSDQMAVAQDGQLLAAAELGAELAAKLGGARKFREIAWGKGVFGAFGGQSLQGRVETN
jgi:hypothetical protein